MVEGVDGGVGGCAGSAGCFDWLANCEGQGQERRGAGGRPSPHVWPLSVCQAGN